MIPRQHYTIVGGTNEKQRTDDARRREREGGLVHAKDTELILSKASALLPGSRGRFEVLPRTAVAGLRPIRSAGIRLGWDEKDARIVHLSGLGGSGWTIGLACARDVCALVDERSKSLGRARL